MALNAVTKKSSVLVSIIVPIYGVEKFIERCARSIFEQTYENLEIIFVNDCTPDNSVKIINNIINEYPNRRSQTQIINHEQNKGLAGARLTGLKASTGYYIQNIDSDDYLDKNMIDEMVALAKKESADITICDFLNIYPNHTKHLYVNPSLNPHILLQQILTGEVHSSVCNKLIKRSLYFDNNIFPIEGLNMREDLSVMFRLLYFAKKIAYIPQPFYNYIQTNTASYTATKMSLAHQKNAFELIRLMQSFFDTNLATKEFQQAFRYFKAGIICSIALYGDLKYYKQEAFLFKDVCIRDIILKPASSKILKIAGTLLVCHLLLMLLILRSIRILKTRLCKRK